jgi:RNA polymerase sigma-70 factor (ECF subfamily)
LAADVILSDDWELLRLGDWEALFGRHKDRVYRLGVKMLGDRAMAEDLVQEVFARLYQGRGRWAPKAPFPAFLCRLTMNTIREFSRQKGRRGRPLDEAAAVEAREADAPRSPVSGLQEALGALPERQREVLVLRFYEGCSVRETARVLGCREGTVKAHLHRAMTVLRERLRREGRVLGVTT